MLKIFTVEMVLRFYSERVPRAFFFFMCQPSKFVFVRHSTSLCMFTKMEDSYLTST